MSRKHPQSFHGRCKVAVVSTDGQRIELIRGLRFNGEEHTYKEWTEISGLPLINIRQRASMGWSAEDILTTDVEIRGCCPVFIYKSKLRKEQHGNHI
jgi:hypothetical protein